MPKAERWRLVGLALIVAGLVTLMFRLAGEAYDRRFQPLPYSYGQHQYGAKGLARLLERNGYGVRSLKRPYARLPKDAQMLIVFPMPISLESMTLASRWTSEDSEHLERWVQSGGVLVLMASDTRLPEVFRSEGRPVGIIDTPGKRIDAQPLWRPEWLAGVRSVRMGDFGRLRFPSSEMVWIPLLGDAGGALVAIMRYEKGYVLECADWLWLTNGFLRQADNALFFLAFVKQVLPRGGIIYFDDAGLGDIEPDTPPPQGFWGYAPPELRIAFAHLTVLVAVVMFSLGRRFGLPLPSRPRHPALGEYVDALANLYGSAKAVQPAFATVIDDVRRRLCRQMGLPAGTTLLQLVQSLPPESPLREALAEAPRALQNPNLSEAEAMRLIKRIATAWEQA